MKTLLDSVHGTISIPKELFERVIDTEYFQRLRRIEQNSCRSVFPSARHDRFIHSLGVYHLGSRISDWIVEEFGPKSKKKRLPENWETVIETYKLACLLHDVAHTPFSHTFEDFFDYDDTLGEIRNLLGDNEFSADSNTKEKAALHELLSAMLSVKVFKSKFSEKDKINWILLVRMITGFKYLNDEKIPKKTFENAMIELIHGKIIDADGLDYVCRDVWAGGYRNFNIDLNRLIRSVNIQRDDNGDYSVVYSSKALNEIETVLNVKNFQYLYVLNHHKVKLEQHYLKEAMKSAACYHNNIEIPNPTPSERDNALRSLCDFNIFTKPKKLKSSYILYHPTDDDFVALMKLTANPDMYIKGWFSHDFPHKPLWKSKLEYFNIFNSVIKSLSEDSGLLISDLLDKKDFKDYLVQNLEHISEDDIIVIKIEPKVRRLDANLITVRLNKENIPYSQLNHDMFSVIGTQQPFCYVYFNFNRLGEHNRTELTKALIAKIKDYLRDCLRKTWDEDNHSVPAH